MASIIRYINSEYDLSAYRSAAFAGNYFVSRDTGAVYRAGESGELGGIGDFFKKIGSLALPALGTIAAPFTGGMSLALVGAVNAIGGVGAGLLGGIGGGGGGTLAKGLEPILAKGNEVMATFPQLKEKIASDAAFQKSDAYAAADKLVAIFSDTTQFYPAKSGKDAAALAKFKQDAAAAAAEIKTFADSIEKQKIQAAQTAQAAQNGGVAQNGNVYQNSGGSLPFNLSWAEIGLGAGAIYFLTRR